MEQVAWLKNKEGGVYFLTPTLNEFEKIYTSVRDKEGRMLSDEEVKALPISKRLSKEWQKRSWTAQRFRAYANKKAFSKILEIGCGNGWFTNWLASDVRNVIGLDVGATELQQAARCFHGNNLDFICCSDWSLLPSSHFDCIVFNGSLHYFQPNTAFWQSLYRMLKPQGEIHVLDTPFYSSKEAKEARERSTNYFEKLGENHAITYYHQLRIDQLPVGHQVLYQPSRLLNKLISTRSPFPWIKIQAPA